MLFESFYLIRGLYSRFERISRRKLSCRSVSLTVKAHTSSRGIRELGAG
jgi:hypothetical protein